ncbi:MAG: hypothetical protein IKM19_01470, partial [Firmicutes bacterium]|nr:hypothetical protein [Bacillota bacterium]
EEMGGMFMTFEDKLKDLQWEYEDMLAEKDAEIKALKEAHEETVRKSQHEIVKRLREQGVSEDIIRAVTGECSE